jgi:hypothetical protein
MTTPAAATGSTPILPPRPNLGPEPWPEPAWPAGWIAGAVIAAALILVAAWWSRRRRRRRRARPNPPEASGAIGSPATPEGRLVALAEAARAALIVHFGDHWVAKTTEEVVAAPALAADVGPERVARLAELLRAADRAKFAGAADEDGQGEGWDAWVADFAAALAAAGATSRIKGK